MTRVDWLAYSGLSASLIAAMISLAEPAWRRDENDRRPRRVAAGLALVGVALCAAALIGVWA